VYDMVATTQIHVLGLDIYGYGALSTAASSIRLTHAAGYDMNTTLAIRKSCSTSDVGLTPNVSEVAASDVGDDPAVKTFSQNVQKVQDDITALKTELVTAKAGMADAAAAEDKAMFRSDVMRINTELERLGRKEELLLQLMLEKMKQVKEVKDAARRAADKAVQSEMTAADLNDRLLGELRHSDIDTLVCWRAWSAAMPLVTGTGGGAGRKSVSFWTCSCQREIIDYPSTTCKCVRDCPYVSDRSVCSFAPVFVLLFAFASARSCYSSITRFRRFRGWAPTKTCNEGSQVLPLLPSTTTHPPLPLPSLPTINPPSFCR
jgi:hypothetical protein